MHPYSLLLLTVSLSLAHSSGYMEIRLKSAFAMNVTVETVDGIYFPSNKRVFTVPLVPNREGFVTNIPVQFGRPGIVLVKSGAVEKFGLHYATVRSERWNTRLMTITSAKIHLPFTGFEIEIRCDPNWYGLHCDAFCNSDVAEAMGRRCNDQQTLGCPEGLRGWNCDEHIRPDSAECGCQNGGKCISLLWPAVRKDTLFCECALGFEGVKCERKSFNYATNIDVKLYGSDHKWDLLNHFFNHSLVDNEFYGQR